MKLHNLTNGSLVSVSEELGERLIASGSFQEHKPTTKTTRKTAPKQETKEEK